MKGILLNEESLALEVIHNVGPRGHYLQESHTYEHFKKIKYYEIFERMVYDEWKAVGGKSFEKRFQEVTLKKMEHRPDPLSEDITKTLDEMQRGWQ